MEERSAADPKIIVAVQMLSIGIILVILALAVFFVSPVTKMTPFIRLTFIISIICIFLVGLSFFIGGIIRHKKAKKK